jgi:hypothetical protein
MKNKILFCFLFIVTICGNNIELFGQNIQSFIQNFSEEADVIVIGKVVSQKSEWNSDKNRISTKVTIQVDEFLKGNNLQNNLVVTHPGGEVGEVGELYSHMPKFTNDEEVLLFAIKDKAEDTFKVLQGENGKITLIKDEKTGEKLTSSNVRVSELKKVIKKYIAD